MSDQKFVDGVGEVRMRDGVIRLDLLALSATRRDKEGEPVPEFVEQLVMSPQAFLRVFRSLANAVGEMQNAGILKSGNPEPAANEPISEPAASSPNF